MSAKKYQCKHATNLDTSPVNASKESNITTQGLDNLKLMKYMSTTYIDDPEKYQSDISSSEDSFCLQVRIWKQHNQNNKFPSLPIWLQTLPTD